MPPSPPPPTQRKFAPTPIETTTRSSKQPEQTKEEAQVPKLRRFRPEPFETSSTSSSARRPNTPETGDLNDLKPRRFAPQPVETTTRSSKDKKEDADKEQKLKPRRFAPQPVETSHRSSKDKDEDKTGKPHARFTPQLVETTHGGNRSNSDTSSAADFEKKRPPRKFAPILIDTAKRSRRASDSKPAITFDDKTEHDHHHAAKEHRHHINGTKLPSDRDGDLAMSGAEEKGGTIPIDLLDKPSKLKRTVAPLDGSSPSEFRSQQRTHSFRCPDLDTIESSESDRESDSSSSSSEHGQGSPITASDSSFNEIKHPTRIRESIDENFGNYFVGLEAKRAEKRLREQALAAFPNSDFHEPIQHYVNADKDSDSDVSIDYRPVTYEGHDEDEIMVNMVRRESTKAPWEQLEMQQHAEKLEQERRVNQVADGKSAPSPWWNPAFAAAQPDNEIRSMRNRARPPMLGSDLEFPRCRSPEPARFDVTQGSAALRQQMCYLAEHAEAEAKRSSAAPALWSNASKKAVEKAPAQKKKESTVTPPSSPAKGLWGGFCSGGNTSTQSGLTAPTHVTGLVTPRRESANNVFEKSFSGLPNGVELTTVPLQTPPTPSVSINNNGDLHTIDRVLVSERELDMQMEREYPDAFITQVYNYLSLGYPSLARAFDDELSKITRIDVAQLRQDDVKAKNSPRGYIRLGPDFEGGGGVEREESCVRWVALKSYIREWAKQERDMVSEETAAGNWGAGARRGSWAI